MKIAIIGYSGSGKSTLAKRLAALLYVDCLHLDTVHWLPGWVENTDEQGSATVKQFMDTHDGWVIDGNYARYLQNRRLQEADAIIQLLFNRFTCLSRVLKRYKANKGRSRNDIGVGCIEKIDVEFLWWVLAKGRTRRRRKHFTDIATAYSSKTVVICNQKQLDAWLNAFVNKTADNR